jgi:hypothetical protein
MSVKADRRREDGTRMRSLHVGTSGQIVFGRTVTQTSEAA